MTAGPGRVPRIKVVCVTPFRDDGSLDERGLAEEVARLAAHGFGIYVGSFGSGEGHLLDDAENRRTLQVAVATAAGRAPVYAAAVGFTDTRRVIGRVQEAIDMGVDAVQVMPPRPGPPNVPPPPAELEGYFQDVLAGTSGPIHLTNEGFMVGYTVPIGLLARLVEENPRIESVNTTDTDPWQVVELTRAIGDRVPVHTGLLTQLPLALTCGAAGPLGFEAVIAPGLMTSVVESFHAGNLAAFGVAYNQALRLHRTLMRYGNPRSIKVALELLGFVGAPMRRPYLPLPAAAVEDIRSALHEIGLL